MDQTVTPARITIRHASDASEVGQRARQIAAAAGHSGRASDEIALAGLELATNIVKYAHAGDITIQVIHGRGRRGIQIEASDRGPGIRNFEEALTDGFSTSGSLGYGLGTVHRIMDELEIVNADKGQPGTHLVSRRWVRPAAPVSGACPLDIGAATRPHLGFKQNGDAFVIKKWSQRALVGVIDGLGHGQYAHAASQKALQFVESHYDQPLENLFLGVQRVCRGTRGVVMALALLAWPENLFYYATVGNVATRVINAPQPVRFQVRRGILGKNAPRPLITRHAWRAGQMLILHSDGIASHWPQPNVLTGARKSATETSYQLMRAYGKDSDDATVVVVRDMEKEGRNT